MEKNFNSIVTIKEMIKYNEPFYLRAIVLISLAMLAAIVPFVGLLVGLLIWKKSKNFSSYCERMTTFVDEFESLHAAKGKIITEAETQADEIIKSAQARANEIIDAAKIDAQKILAETQATVDKKIQVAERQLWDLNLEMSRAEELGKNKLARIQAEIDKREIYMNEIEAIKNKLGELRKKESAQIEKIDKLMRLRKSVNNAVKIYLSGIPNQAEQMINLLPDLIREIESLAPSVMLRLHCMNYKDLRRAFNDNEKIIEETLSRYELRYTTKTNRAIYRLMVIALRAELQNILYTLTFTKLDDSIAAVRDVTNKYLNIAREGNQTISSTLAKFIGEIETLFIDAVKIEYEYYVKREAARQEQLELRAKIREEAEEQRRLKEQEEQMTREESKYNAEIEKLLEQKNSTDDDEKNQALLEKIQALETKLAELSTKKDEIISLQNGKAGYVYIISNLGSFGADIFKVGMTRRLDPQERIDELGNASVPFKFDVHSFIFSEDAVKLESELHTALDSRRLNKVNLRKEFFKVSIDELERLVEKFDPTAEFNRTMQAEQYYQSLSAAES